MSLRLEFGMGALVRAFREPTKIPSAAVYSATIIAAEGNYNQANRLATPWCFYLPWRVKLPTGQPAMEASQLWSYPTNTDENTRAKMFCWLAHLF